MRRSRAQTIVVRRGCARRDSVRSEPPCRRSGLQGLHTNVAETLNELLTRDEGKVRHPREATRVQERMNEARRETTRGERRLETLQNGRPCVRLKSTTHD